MSENENNMIYGPHKVRIMGIPSNHTDRFCMLWIDADCNAVSRNVRLNVSIDNVYEYNDKRDGYVKAKDVNHYIGQERLVFIGGTTKYPQSGCVDKVMIE